MAQFKGVVGSLDTVAIGTGKQFKRTFNEIEKSGVTSARDILREYRGFDSASARIATSTQSHFTKAFRAIKSEASGLGGVLKGAFSIASGNLLAGGISGLASGVVNIGKGFYDLNSQLERAQVGFKTLLGSEQSATKFINEIKQFSKTTPFELGGAVSASQKFLAQGLGAEKVIPTIRGIASAIAAAGGSNADFEAVAEQFGQTIGKVSVEYEDLKEIVGRGIPVFKLAAGAIGTTEDQFRKLVSEGRVRGKEFVEIIGGVFSQKYPKALDELAKTTDGALTNVKESLMLAGVDSLQPVFKDLRETLNGINKELEGPGFARFAENSKKIGESVSRYLTAPLKELIIGAGNSGNASGVEAFLSTGSDAMEGKFNQPGDAARRKIEAGQFKSLRFKDFIDVEKEWNDIKNIGKILGGAVPEGFTAGIASKAGEVKKAGEAVTTTTFKSIKESAGINSPALKFVPLGEGINEGIAKGLLESDALDFAINSVVDRALENGLTRAQARSLRNLRKLEEKEPEFLPKLIREAQKRKINPDHLLNTMALETAGTFNPRITNPFGYTGLIQFGVPAAKDVGTTTSKLRAMTATQQLDYVFRYLDQKAKQYGALDSQSKIYQAIGLGNVKDDDLTWRKKGTLGYSRNKAWDFDMNGVITRGELGEAAAARLGAGQFFSFTNQNTRSTPPPQALTALPSALAIKPATGFIPETGEFVLGDSHRLTDIPKEFLIELPKVEKAVIGVAQSFAAISKEAGASVSAVKSVAEVAKEADAVVVATSIAAKEIPKNVEQTANTLTLNTSDAYARLIMGAKDAKEKAKQEVGEFAQFLDSTFTAAFRDSFERGPRAFFDRMWTSAKETLARIGAEITKNLVLRLANLKGGGQQVGVSSAGASSGGGILNTILGSFGGGSGGGGFSIPGIGPGGTAPFVPSSGGGSASSAGGFRGLINQALGFPVFKGAGVQLPAAKAIGNIIPTGIDPATGAPILGGGATTGGVGGVSALSSLASGGLLLGGGLLGSKLGGDSTIGKLLGGAGGGLVAGAIGASGAFGGGIAAALPALFSNPITAVIGGALLAGALAFRLFGNKDLKDYRKLINSEYAVDIKENKVLSQFKQLGQEVFGKEWKKRKLETIRLEPARNLIANYAETHGQGNNKLALERKKLDPNDPVNRFEIPIQREFGGRVWPGQDFLVGERRPEVVRFDRPGTVYPSMQAYNQASGNGQSHITNALLQAILARLTPADTDQFMVLQFDRHREAVADAANRGQRGSGYAYNTLSEVYG